VNRTIVLVFKPDTRRRLHTAASVFRPVVCTTEAELEAALRRKVYDCVIVGLRNATGEPTTPTIARIHRVYPRLWIIGCLEAPDERANEVRLVAACARVGVDEIYIAGIDPSPIGHSAIDVSTCGARVAKHVLYTVGDRVTGDVRRFLEYGILHAHQVLTVASVAAKLNVTRQTLLRQCTRDHLPAPQQLLSWARLLVASALLTQPGCSGDQIGHRMFGSPSALRNMLRRYVGLSTDQVKARDGVELMLSRFIDALEHRVPVVDSRGNVLYQSQECSVA
jgi:AraC-like DNA-binding protein